MPDETLDDFQDLSGWTAIASGQARLGLSPDRGPSGGALRLDFDFHGGGGFVVARKAFALELPDSYCFDFRIRGVAPLNIFEFKLVDATGQTWYGRLSYGLRLETGDTLRLRLSGDLAVPPGGIVVQPPLPRPILRVEAGGGRPEVAGEGFTVRGVPAEVRVRFR